MTTFYERNRESRLAYQKNMLYLTEEKKIMKPIKDELKLVSVKIKQW